MELTADLSSRYSRSLSAEVSVQSRQSRSVFAVLAVQINRKDLAIKTLNNQHGHTNKPGCLAEQAVIWEQAAQSRLEIATQTKQQQQQERSSQLSDRWKRESPRMRQGELQMQ